MYIGMGCTNHENSGYKEIPLLSSNIMHNPLPELCREGYT